MQIDCAKGVSVFIICPQQIAQITAHLSRDRIEITKSTGFFPLLKIIGKFNVPRFPQMAKYILVSINCCCSCGCGGVNCCCCRCRRQRRVSGVIVYDGKKHLCTGSSVYLFLLAHFISMYWLRLYLPSVASFSVSIFV